MSDRRVIEHDSINRTLCGGPATPKESRHVGRREREREKKEEEEGEMPSKAKALFPMNHSRDLLGVLVKDERKVWAAPAGLLVISSPPAGPSVVAAVHC